MEAILKAKELLLTHYEKVSGVPANSISKMVQFFNTDSHWKTAKECALITVVEILYLMVVTLKWDKKANGNIHYWQEVKAEIEKL